MSLLDKLERRFGRFAVPQATLALVAAQVVVYLMAQANPEVLSRFVLAPGKVLQGEYWRLATFLVLPPSANVLFAFFFWYIFYLMGTSLEQNWGAFRYNVYLLIGYAATVAAAFVAARIDPGHAATNAFLEGSVFLAFAFLFPDFELYIFFLLPVKIKWLASLAWIGYALALLFGEWVTRLLVGASIANFLLFFAPEIVRKIRYGRRRMAVQVKSFERDRPFHRCTVCGMTDRSHPKMEFRYCSKCDGAYGYCTEHIRNHEHITGVDQSRAK